MKVQPKTFTHVGKFTGYMKIIYNIVNKSDKKQRILDMPAGNGILSSRLIEDGHDVVCGDINDEKPSYVYVNMEERLPFDDGEFDTVICMEGLEHMLNAVDTINEIARVCKPGGRIIISLPNIQSLFSRFQFLCTGTFFMYPAFPYRIHDAQGIWDRGHITPLSATQLTYLFFEQKAKLIELTGDRFKRKLLIPFFLPFMAIGYIWSRRWNFQYGYNEKEHAVLSRSLFSPKFMFSRSLIMVFEKEKT